jgi:hypothetical protein
MTLEGFTSRWMPVGRVQPLGHEAQDGHLLLDGHRRGGGRQGLARDELHRDERLAVDHVRLEHLADVRVVHAGLGARLVQGAVGAPAAAEQLQRDAAAEPRVEGLVDRPHRAAAEELLDLEPAEAARRRSFVSARGRRALPRRLGGSGRRADVHRLEVAGGLPDGRLRAHGSAPSPDEERGARTSSSSRARSRAFSAARSGRAARFSASAASDRRS